MQTSGIAGTQKIYKLIAIYNNSENIKLFFNISEEWMHYLILYVRLLSPS